jgi:hypothetical protein
MNTTPEFLDGFKHGVRGPVTGRIVTGTRAGNKEFKAGADAGNKVRRAITLALADNGRIEDLAKFTAALVRRVEAGDLRALEVA